MRAWLCLAAVAAALALCLWPASAEGPPGRVRHDQISAVGAPERARLDHIKRQILSKLGLGSRPPPLRAPPRDVVRQILARAADPRDERDPHARLEPEVEDSAPREIIAIAKRAIYLQACLERDFIKVELATYGRDMDIISVDRIVCFTGGEVHRIAVKVCRWIKYKSTPFPMGY